MALDPNKCAQELARLLDAQTDVCREILEKSKKQQQLVEERRESELLSLLDDKQKLIEKREKLNAETAPHRTQWENGAREAAGADAHAGVERAWNGLRDVLQEIIALEDASQAYLQEQKGRLSVDIGKLQRGKIVNKAYGAPAFKPPAQPRYSDKQG